MEAVGRARRKNPSAHCLGASRVSGKTKVAIIGNIYMTDL